MAANDYHPHVIPHSDLGATNTQPLTPVARVLGGEAVLLTEILHYHVRLPSVAK